MVKKFDKNVSISIKDYKGKKENEGKVAVFNFETSMLVAEGDGATDWVELELLCEDLRKNGNYRVVIVPDSRPTIKDFRRII